MIFKESEILEFKKSTSELKEAIITIAAMLNKHQKGELYFGIRNNGEVVGQDISDKTIRDVSKAISDNIEPKIFPTIIQKKIKNKSCIHIKYDGSEIPYSAYGRGYLRVGTENKQLSLKESGKLFSKKNEMLWENGISSKSIKDIDIPTLKEFIQKANKAKRIDYKYTNVKDTLNKLHLLNGNKLLRAAEVLFCDDNPLEIQVAVFAGTDKLTFLDINLLKGNIFSLIKQSESYIKEHMNWRANLTPDGREEIPEVPLRAITEAIVNSLCHRDYINPKGNEIAFYKDKIEIYDTGQFPEDYSPEDFIERREKSILRNPLIANTLYFSKDIEKWGSGLRRIYEACQEARVRVEFQRLKSGFSVVFYRPVDKKIQTVIKKHAQKGSEISSEISSEKILDHIKKDNHISAKQLSERMGISSRAVEKHIANLKANGKLKRMGPDKGGHWEILKEVKR